MSLLSVASDSLTRSLAHSMVPSRPAKVPERDLARAITILRSILHQANTLDALVASSQSPKVLSPPHHKTQELSSVTVHQQPQQPPVSMAVSARTGEQLSIVKIDAECITSVAYQLLEIVLFPYERERERVFEPALTSEAAARSRLCVRDRSSSLFSFSWVGNEITLLLDRAVATRVFGKSPDATVHLFQWSALQISEGALGFSTRPSPFVIANDSS